MSEMNDDLGPWFVNEWSNNKVVLQSDDFTHDVALIVTGDFESHEQKLQYATKLAARMNQMLGTRPLGCNRHGQVS